MPIIQIHMLPGRTARKRAVLTAIHEAGDEHRRARRVLPGGGAWITDRHRVPR